MLFHCFKNWEKYKLKLLQRRNFTFLKVTLLKWYFIHWSYLCKLGFCGIRQPILAGVELIAWKRRWHLIICSSACSTKRQPSNPLRWEHTKTSHPEQWSNYWDTWKGRLIENSSLETNTWYKTLIKSTQNKSERCKRLNLCMRRLGIELILNSTTSNKLCSISRLSAARRIEFDHISSLLWES